MYVAGASRCSVVVDDTLPFQCIPYEWRIRMLAASQIMLRIFWTMPVRIETFAHCFGLQRMPLLLRHLASLQASRHQIVVLKQE